MVQLCIPVVTVSCHHTLISTIAEPLLVAVRLCWHNAAVGCSAQTTLLACASQKRPGNVLANPKLGCLAFPCLQVTLLTVVLSGCARAQALQCPVKEMQVQVGAGKLPRSQGVSCYTWRRCYCGCRGN